MTRFWFIAILLIPIFGAPALAGITVTSYSTTALTNGYAPSLNGPYFAQQTLENVTPAMASVSGDWTGPNADGTPDTWHFVGASQANSTTTFDANRYTVTAAGSFEYTLDTRAGFVDPSSSSIFGPGGAANYRGFFEIDTPATYFVSIQLNQHSGVSLGSFEFGFIFNHFNFGTAPILLQFEGAIPPAHYQFLASTGVAVPNLPNGINHRAASGSFEDLTFVAQVPEPSALGIAIASFVGTMRRRTRKRPCARTSN